MFLQISGILSYRTFRARTKEGMELYKMSLKPDFLFADTNNITYRYHFNVGESGCTWGQSGFFSHYCYLIYDLYKKVALPLREGEICGAQSPTYLPIDGFKSVNDFTASHIETSWGCGVANSFPDQPIMMLDIAATNGAGNTNFAANQTLVDCAMKYTKDTAEEFYKGITNDGFNVDCTFYYIFGTMGLAVLTILLCCCCACAIDNYKNSTSSGRRGNNDDSGNDVTAQTEMEYMGDGEGQETPLVRRSTAITIN